MKAGLRNIFSLRGKKSDQKADSKISLSMFLSLTVMFCTLLIGLIFSAFSLSTVYEAKLSDVWGILFLQFEREGKLFAENLQAISVSTGEPVKSEANQQFPAADYWLKNVLVEGDSVLTLIKITGRLPAELPLAELEREDLRFDAKIVILQYKGENFRAIVDLTGQRDGTKMPRLTLWPIDIDAVAKKSIGAGSAPANSHQILRYIITREGRLVFSSDSSVSPVGLVKRELIQKFTQNPLGRGFYKVSPQHGDDFYGFFNEVPGSNLIMFAEAPLSLVTDQLLYLVKRFSGILVLAIAISFILLQGALFSTKAALRDLIKNATYIGQGHFDLKFHHRGWGEINTLIGAFSKMSKSLVERDARIIQLHKEETEKLRLANELEIASRLQKNFLPDAPLTQECGLEVFGKYVPAVETAGDWYNYHYNSKTGEAIIAVADVSGHGAGSSMFTAIIAGAFHDLAKTSDKPFDAEFFAQKLNLLFGGIGKHQWHTTLWLMVYSKVSGTLKITSAGSTPALHLVSDKSGSVNGKYLLMPSSLIGLAGETSFATKSLDIKPGERIVICTDGLFEACNPKNRQYGKKRLQGLCTKQMDGISCQSMVEEIHHDWYEYQKTDTGQVVAQDDLCILSVKVLP